jgi:hypothetical protein
MVRSTNHDILHYIIVPSLLVLPVKEPHALSTGSLLQRLAAEGADNQSLTTLQALVREPLIPLKGIAVGTERIANYLVHDMSKTISEQVHNMLQFSILPYGTCHK